MTPTETALIIGAVVSFITGVGGMILAIVSAVSQWRADKRTAKKDDIAALKDTYDKRIEILEKHITELQAENAQIKAENVLIKEENRLLRAELDEYMSKPKRTPLGN